jgi:hypothetical protein
VVIIVVLLARYDKLVAYRLMLASVVCANLWNVQVYYSVGVRYVGMRGETGIYWVILEL